MNEKRKNNSRVRREGYMEMTDGEKIRSLLEKGGVVKRCAFQCVDFSNYSSSVTAFRDCIFMGCEFTGPMRRQIDGDCLIFSHIDVPYNAFRNELYNAASLYEGYKVGADDGYSCCYDSVVYKHYLSMGKTSTDMKETLARALHDRAVSDALNDFLSGYDERKIVGIMGGHGLLRTDDMFRKIVCISKLLTENGCLMISGGGPGAMEATHLGAWMAGRSESEVEDALDLLSDSPGFFDAGWLDTAFAVMNKYPQSSYESLGVPTWLYGHEPSTPFATRIAKYFNNAIREDGILTIAMGGIIFSPGSAGTMQEIFQDAVQNHYLTLGYASPMVFLGKQYWTEELPVYSMLLDLVDSGKYRNLILSISDSADEIVKQIKAFSEG